MQFLTRFSLKNVAAVFIISALLIGGGIYSFSSLKSDLLPDIEFPQLSITAVYPGASSQDVNEQITTPLETVLKGVEGLEQLSSQSLESVSRVQISFPIGTNMDKTTQQVNDLIEGAGLPDSVTTEVERFSFGAFPIISAAIFPKDDSDIEKWVTGSLKQELLKIKGVSSVALSGVARELLEIEVNKDKAKQLGISLNDIKEAVQSSYFSFPAGSVEEDSVVIPVRVDQKLAKLDELRRLTVSSAATQQSVRLSEVAEIHDEPVRSEVSRYNKRNSLALLINKKQDANTVEVADKVFETLDKHKDRIEYVLSFDQSKGIKDSIHELIEKGLFGALFASLAVLLFLRNVRATFIAILSIPLSLLIAAIFLKWFNITLNVMSLAGMAVSVGRVVDDSIIVIENIYRKMKQEPAGDRTVITMAATKEMMNAILSSTITTVVVFLPLGLVGGITGAFFMPFALTVVVALLASLIVAVTVVPILARVSFVNMHEDEKDPYYVRWYEHVIHWALRRKPIVLLIALVLLVGSLPLAGGLGFIFLPNEQQKIVVAEFSLPASTALAKTNEVSLQIEDVLDQQKKSYPKVFVSIGNYDYESGTTLTNRAQYFIELNQDANVDDAIERVRSLFEEVAGKASDKSVVTVAELSSGGPPSNNNVDIDLYSDDLNKLESASKQVEQLMAKRDDLRYVSNNMKEKQRQWTVQLNNEKMKELGIASFTVLGIISDQTRPLEIGTYKLDDKEQTIELNYDRQVADKSELEELLVYGKNGAVPLREIGTVQEEEVFTSIQKLDERVFAQVTAQVVGNDVSGVTKSVIADVDKLKLPEGVSLEGGGGSDDTMQTIYDLLVAVAVAIGLVYLTMLIFFGKARVPFVILSSLLFVPIGAIAALVVAHEPLSMSAMIGFLMLVGIVVTNAIVLVDRINQNRKAGLTVHLAIIEAGKTRLRPILMTALATIAALLPLVFSTPQGGLISRGLALVVVGGLTTSTLLTVIVLPVIYELAFRKHHKREVREKRAIAE